MHVSSMICPWQIQRCFTHVRLPCHGSLWKPTKNSPETSDDFLNITFPTIGSIGYETGYDWCIVKYSCWRHPPILLLGIQYYIPTNYMLYVHMYIYIYYMYNFMCLYPHRTFPFQYLVGLIPSYTLFDTPEDILSFYAQEWERYNSNYSHIVGWYTPKWMSIN